MKLQLIALAVALAMGGVVKKTQPSGDVFLRSAPLSISKEGYNLILKYEVGGGPAYYSRFLARPTWPGGASGVTIGVGYDLGYNSRAQIASDWRDLPSSVISRLQSAAGVKGDAARRLTPTLHSISIPWDMAERVYLRNTVPRFAKLTESAYPGTATMHPHAQGSMLSWVFNRGEGITSSSRDTEKRAMRVDIPEHVERLPKHFRDSKRLWVGRGMDGLLLRREDEARLIESIP